MCWAVTGSSRSFLGRDFFRAFLSFPLLPLLLLLPRLPLLLLLSESAADCFSLFPFFLPRFDDDDDSPSSAAPETQRDRRE